MKTAIVKYQPSSKFSHPFAFKAPPGQALLQEFRIVFDIGSKRWMEGRREGGREGGKRKEGRKEGRKQASKQARKEGRKRNEKE